MWHTSHLNGFSPVCVRTWFLRWVVNTVVYGQYGQACRTINGFLETKTYGQRHMNAHPSKPWVCGERLVVQGGGAFVHLGLKGTMTQDTDRCNQRTHGTIITGVAIS